jgi:hypothetical protein
MHARIHPNIYIERERERERERARLMKWTRGAESVNNNRMTSSENEPIG